LGQPPPAHAGHTTCGLEDHCAAEFGEFSEMIARPRGLVRGAKLR